MSSKNKAFTLIELLAVILILGIIALIAIPMVLNVIKDAKKGALKDTASKILNAAEQKTVLDDEEKIYIIQDGKLENNDLNIKIKKNIDFGIIVVYPDDSYTVVISDGKYCAIGSNDSEVTVTDGKCDLDTGLDVYVLSSKKLVATNSNYSTIIYNNSTNADIEVKYITSRVEQKFGTDSSKWDSASTLGNKSTKLEYSGDTIIPGTFYVHLLIDDGTTKTETVSTSVHVVIDEKVRIKKLTDLYNTLVSNNTPQISTSSIIETDFVQPWTYVEDNLLILTRKFKALKRAGYKNVIIQYPASIVEDADGNLKLGEVFYTSKLDQYIDEDTVMYDETIDKMMQAAINAGIDVYMGSVVTSLWWDTDNLKSNDFYNKLTEITNDIQTEVYNKYKDFGNIKGWYWANEMYTSPDGMENYWVNYLNNFIDHINTINSSLPLLVSPFISSITGADNTDVANQWTYIVNNTNFKSGDIIAFQDGYGNAEYGESEINDFISIIRDSIKTNKPYVKFYLNVENYASEILNGGTKSTEIARLIKQLDIGKFYADGFTSFSYLHYYNPYQMSPTGKGLNGNQYDINYRNMLGFDTSDTSMVLASTAPAGGYVYVDTNGDEAPIPAGFTISTVASERVIKNGLVIKDTYGNEFVFIPTYLGIKEQNHVYRVNEGHNAAYSRFLGNGLSDLTTVHADTLPSGVANEYGQITKYFGFYIGRYEASYNNNGGKNSIAIKKTTDINASNDFWPVFADSSAYDGKLMLNIKYSEAKVFAEKMASDYGYSSGIKTGIPTGTQWDSMLRWCELQDYHIYKSYDGSQWGNYTDSIGSAASGNYESGVLKGTGSNEGWKAKNVYDVAGNLREWTSELNANGDALLRSNSYSGAGKSGSPSYAIPISGYLVPDAGFRVVLYIP